MPDIASWVYWLGVLAVLFAGLVGVSGGMLLFVFAFRLVRGWVNA